MRKLCSKLLLTSALVSAGTLAAQAADLPVKAAAPIEYVRVCGAYGAGFFYIPGTDTCLRLSGRARAEFGYQQNFMRVTNNYGDSTMWRGLLRMNVDARTQTGYGTLRAFLRLEAASRSGNFMWSGTLQRIGKAYAATGQDQNGRLQQYVDVEKAFIQFAGFTAGRASSFFDFYAHDYEIIGVSMGSDVASTNLLAYTQQLNKQITATISMEDPIYRKTGVYAANSTNLFGSAALATASSPLALTFINGTPVGGTFVDVVERNRMPDFVGVLRYDDAWGSAQVSAAVKDVNVGGNLGAFYGVTAPGVALTALNAPVARRVDTEYGFAVQAGVKFNLPFIAPGDGLYLQAGYANGGTQYTGVQFFTAGYITSARPFQGASFAQYLPDATLNPLTGKLQLVDTFSATAAYLHYWTPQWRSAFFGSYAQIDMAKGARLAQGLANAANAFPGAPPNPILNPAGYAYSEVLRDSHQYYVGGSLIWSPVKDLDIGLEGIYDNTILAHGRVIDQNKSTGAVVVGLNAAGQPVAANGAVIRTVNSTDTYQVRLRVQRDF